MSIPNTVVRLLSNVPLSSSYSHVRDFNSKADQTAYFINKTKELYTKFTYQREEQAIKVQTNIDKLYSVNYVMYQNSDYSDKWFYGFVTRKEYVNPNTTAIYFEPDVFQTWLFDFTFKPSYVIREHTNRWNADGSPVINTIDEGLDYGTDYETVSVEQYVPFDDVYFLVIVTKNAMHYADTVNYTNQVLPSINGLPQPLNYYIHPFKLDGSLPPVDVNGAYTMSPILDVLEGLFTQTGAVNNVVSLYVCEYFDNIAFTNGTLTFSTADFERASVSDDSAVNINTIRVKQLKTYRSKLKNFGDKYTGYAPVEESKLLMYPYTVLILDDFKGNRLELKNEYIDSDTLSIRVKGSLGTNNKVSYQVEKYLGQTNLTGMDYGVINNNPNDVPILTDMLAAYLQGNRNTIENNKSAMMFNALTTTMGGALGGALGGGRLGIVGALGGAGVGAINSYYQIEGLNAKQQDIRNVPAQVTNMGGNTSFDFGNDLSGLYIIKKQITKEYRDRLEQYFKMFGYRINELKTPNLKTRKYFNFIHTADCNLSGNIPQDDLSSIKEIFNNGVTIWHTDIVGDYSVDNIEV